MTKKFYPLMIFGVFMHVQTAQAQDVLSPLLGSILPEDKQIENKDPVSEEAAPEDGWGGGTLMYNKTTLFHIEEAVKAHKDNVPIEIVLPDLFPKEDNLTAEGLVEVNKEEIVDSLIDEPESVVESIVEELLEPEEIVDSQYYLSSIMYFSPNSWAFWLNGEKFTPDSPHPIFEVHDVKKEEVSFVWRKPPISIAKLDQSVFLPIANTSYLTNQRNIVINEESRDMSFILKTNQRINITPLSIEEGRKSTSTASAQPIDDVIAPKEEAFLAPLTRNNPADGIAKLYELKKQVMFLKSIMEKNLDTLNNTKNY